MTKPEVSEKLESETDDALESEDDALESDDETRPDRATGKSDPWHGLDDFED